MKHFCDQMFNRALAPHVVDTKMTSLNLFKPNLAGQQAAKIELSLFLAYFQTFFCQF